MWIRLDTISNVTVRQTDGQTEVVNQDRAVSKLTHG